MRGKLASAAPAQASASPGSLGGGAALARVLGPFGLLTRAGAGILGPSGLGGALMVMKFAPDLAKRQLITSSSQ
jgi:hypothetical protein